MSIDLSKIPVFLTVAKFGSFTEAAYELFMTQSGVSKSISQLESSLGFPLFIRESRKISLTPEGAHLYQRFSGIMKDVDSAVSDAKSIHSGSIGSFSLGTSGYLPKTPAFERACSLFWNEHRDFKLDMRYMHYPELRKCLIDETLDMILYNTHDLSMLHGFNYMSMFKGECRLYYNSLLAPTDTSRELNIFDFKDRPFVSLDPELVPSFNAYLINCCKAHGFTPNIAKYVSSLQELIHFINISSLVSIFDMALFPLESSDISSITIPFKEGMELPLETVLIWRSGNINPALAAYVSFTSELLGSPVQTI